MEGPSNTLLNPRAPHDIRPWSGAYSKGWLWTPESIAGPAMPYPCKPCERPPLKRRFLPLCTPHVARPWPWPVSFRRLSASFGDFQARLVQKASSPHLSRPQFSRASEKKSVGMWQGVAMDSLKRHPGPPCPTLLRPAGGPPLKRP
jgi:hypothetical protein